MLPMEKYDRLQERGLALRELEEWLKPGLKLQKAEGSAAHRLLDAFASDDVLDLLAAPGNSASFPTLPIGLHTNIFVVQHDWAEAFRGAEEFDSGDFRLPYDISIFEFRISGRRVCALVVDPPEDNKTIVAFVEIGNQWFLPARAIELVDGRWQGRQDEHDNIFAAIPTLLAEQIKAVCVSLEAEVAASQEVTIDAKLNAARQRRGKPPLPDYNIVRLNRQARSVQIGDDDSRARKRLHFRRGHRRHLSGDRKTWVRWCLVGNPDLGFIDKEYRL